MAASQFRRRTRTIGKTSRNGTRKINANQRLSVFKCMKYRITNSALMKDNVNRSYGTQVRR